MRRNSLYYKIVRAGRKRGEEEFGATRDAASKYVSA
jgi:hypothetical protein